MGRGGSWGCSKPPLSHALAPRRHTGPSHPAGCKGRSIERRADDLPAEVQEFLADDLHELDAISDLADQLAIVALYRAVEINTGRIMAHKFGPAALRNASSIRALRTFLMQQQGINIER